MAHKQQKGNKDNQTSTSTGSSSGNTLRKFKKQEINGMMQYQLNPHGNPRGGAFAKVHKGKWQKKEVAIKVYITENFSYWTKEKRFFEEMKKHTWHPHIVDCLGYCDEGSELVEYSRAFLVLEWMDFNLEEKREDLDWQTTIRILVEATDAVKHINSMGMIIGDLKPDAIMLDKKYNVKLVDFNMYAKPKMYAAVLNKAYAALEIRKGKGEAEDTSDVFSLGVIILEQLMNKTTEAFPDKTPEGRNRTHISTEARELHPKGKLKVPERLAKSGCTKKTAARLAELAIQCTNEKFGDRPKIEDLLTELHEIQQTHSS